MKQAELTRFQPYPSYRESGIDWLGEIPAHWVVKRLRSTVTDCQNGVWGDEPDGINDITCVRVADFDRVAHTVRFVDQTLRFVEPQIVETHRLRAGDLLLEKSGGGENQPVGAVVLFDHSIPAVCSNFVARMRVASGYQARFLAYLHAAVYSIRVNTRHIKQSTGIQNLDSTSYLNESAALPSEPEQRAIAAFLDRETARIDGLVAKNERLIELLGERRTALITGVVTKGLDPNIPMKESGVEWLGKVPAHWAIARMWRLSTSTSGGTPAKDERGYWDGGIPWVSPKDMKSRFVESSEDTVTDRAIAETGLHLIAPPVLLIVVRGMILAHSFPVAVTRVPVTINQDMKAVQFCRRVQSEFMAWLFDGIGKSLVSAIVEEAAHGTRALRMDVWRMVEVPVPPENEQVRIIEHLNRETARIDALVRRIHDAIYGLKELRTALIFSAITGKIDVREEVA